MEFSEKNTLVFFVTNVFLKGMKRYVWFDVEQKTFEGKREKWKEKSV